MHNIQQKYAIPRRNQIQSRLAALSNLALPDPHPAQPRQPPYRQANLNDSSDSLQASLEAIGSSSRR